MTDISKRIIREGRGFSSRAEHPRALKDFLVYLVYINMLGHDTSWAQATVIQMCGNKNLQVKKTAYMTASLLIDPTSELTILLTATIQADLKSDNFLTVCTALQAIPTIANAELANVFLPEVIALASHDRDAVKRRALTTLHALLLVDPSAAVDVGKVLIDKLAYKDPAVMFAVLPGLYDLIQQDPNAYKGLVPYFTNILKQASEGKLGRNWTVHRAPAPFLQVTLLRLLGVLGHGDARVSQDMESVIVEVWKRAESLMSQAGNAILFECMKVATSIAPSDALFSMALDTAAVFLSGTDNNLKCAGIEILTRMIDDGDAGKVQQHQMAIVMALRSSDVTLKGRTLDLLFRMAGASNVDVVFTEALNFVIDDAIDDEPRRYAASKLLEVAERFAPTVAWFVESVTELLKKAGAMAPAGAQFSLVRAIGDGDRVLQERMTEAYYELMEANKMVSVPLAKVICWTLGEYGIQSGIPFESLCTTLTDVVESRQTHAPDLAALCILSLSKINVRFSRPLPPETVSMLESLQQAAWIPLSVQQAAFEACSLAKRDLASKGVTTPYEAPGDLSFLDDIAAQAVAGGAAPHLSQEERETMGMTQPREGAPAQTSHLRYEAYEREAPVATFQPAENISGDVWEDFRTSNDTSTTSVVAGTSATRIDDLFGDLSQGPARAPRQAPPPRSEGIHVNRNSNARRWGPTSGAAAQPDGTSRPLSSPASAPVISSPGAPGPRARVAPAPAVDPQQEMLAASLFGRGGGGTAAVGGNGGKAGVARGGASLTFAAAPAPFDLLDMMGDDTPHSNELSDKLPQSHTTGPPQTQASDLDELFAMSTGPVQQPLVDDPFGLLDAEPVVSNGAEHNRRAPDAQPADPFSSLL